MGHTSQQKQSTNHGPAECSYFFKINLALEKTNCLLAFPWHSGHFDLSNLRSCDCPDRCQRKNVVSKAILGAREPLYTEIQKYTKDTIEIHQRHVSSIQPSIKSLLASTLFLVVVIFTGSIVYGQDETDSSDKWEVRLMPYVFFLSLDTEGTINGLSGDVDLSFDDIVDNLDFGAMGRVEAWVILGVRTVMDF